MTKAEALFQLPLFARHAYRALLRRCCGKGSCVTPLPRTPSSPKRWSSGTAWEREETATDDTPGALSNYRVLDMTRILAGPYCTQMLGDLGADVIKIEVPGRGDDTRTWGPPFVNAPGTRHDGESSYFLCANRNKRSVCVDVKNPQGLDLLLELAAMSDVVRIPFLRQRLPNTSACVLTLRLLSNPFVPPRTACPVCRELCAWKARVHGSRLRRSQGRKSRYCVLFHLGVRPVWSLRNSAWV